MRKKLLIVDDQVVNRSILKKILHSQYDILEAGDGEEALMILSQVRTEISAVILDLIMPRLDGYGVLEHMSKNPVLSGIPVIVASQADKSEMEERALKCGARDFIMKPYNPGILKQRLANLIELYESNIRIAFIERDSLTGLFTKDAFYQYARERLVQNPDIEYTLIAADIERFKLVNDSFGNQEGDKVLKFVAEEMRMDIQRFGGLCARINGDHFIAMVPKLDDEEMIKKIATKSQKRMAEYPLNMKISLKLSIYHVQDRELEISIMCDRAILAAASIKGQYDRDYAYYDDSVRQQLLREQQITDSMKQALAAQQFQVYFQPKYGLMSEHIAGAEALVRWIHPEFGFMNPGDFIPLFERNGFITELDCFVWDKTCETIASWIKQGNKYVPVSVNVSRKDIYQEDLPELLTEMVARHGLKPEHLHLEITETAYTQDAQQLIEVVGRLKDAGFIIEMDDFGSGYSSLNMLSELPIDILKLDMRFIQQETEKNESRNILSFIISMAKWMKLAVIAEGVETQEQIDLLRNMDCDYVQGYYYSRPVPEPEFTRGLMEAEVEVRNMAIQSAPLQKASVQEDTKGRMEMLVVDDMEINRAILSEIFREEYVVVEAENGREALEYIQEHFDDIAIIMLDLIMPGMDGFQLLKKLQVNALYRTIPVIVTSQAGRESEAEAFELGANDFLAKPYDPVIARHRVENVTERRKSEYRKHL